MQCASSMANRLILCRSKQLQEPLVAEPLGRYVEQLGSPAHGARRTCAGSAARSRLESSRAAGTRVLDEKIDLVLHQRDQRRDHDRQPVEQQRRQLVTEAFAAAGGKNRQRRTPGQQPADHLLLSRPEIAKAESSPATSAAPPAGRPASAPTFGTGLAGTAAIMAFLLRFRGRTTWKPPGQQ